MRCELKTSEVRRVRGHIFEAEGSMRRRDIRALTPLQRMARRLLLEELARYRAAGRFPCNRDFRAHAAPVFVDHFGSKCAMAHLLEISGQPQLVASIARAQNFARIRELRHSWELRHWLQAAGVALDEAAQIQPSYACVETHVEACGVCTGAEPQIVGEAYVQQIWGGGDQPGLRRALVRIDRIPENEFGVVAGASIPAYIRRNGQRPIVIGLKSAPETPEGYLAREPTNFVDTTPAGAVCGQTAFGSSHPLPNDVFAAAFGASSPEECAARIIAFDKAWGESSCPSLAPKDSAGCSVHSGASESAALGGALSAASLSVIVAVLAYRRRRAPAR
jgi:hypothetical protein